MPKGAGGRRQSTAADHWHRTERDAGRLDRFTDASTLVDDFFDEVERVLEERGVSQQVIRDEAGEA